METSRRAGLQAMLRKAAAPALAALAAFAAAAGELVVAERGKGASWRISVAESPGAAADFAAWELRDYVLQTTSVELPVAYEATPPASGCVRIEQDSAMGESDYRIRADGARVLVTGGSRGVLYAVYDVVETYGGVGWYASWRTVVPELAAFAVPDDLDRLERPAFEMREPGWYDCVYQNLFAARLRTNGHINDFGSRYGGPSAMNPNTAQTGLRHAHTFWQLVPEETYGETHPEYFSWRESAGGRLVGRGSQLCLSNPELRDVLTSNLLEKVAVGLPLGQRYFSVSQNDNRNFCQCGACRALYGDSNLVSEAVVDFVNDVAGRVAERHPGVFVTTLAYTDTLAPPVERVPADNVLVVLCSYDADAAEPLSGSSIEANREFSAALDGWSRLTHNIQVWDYVTDFCHYFMPYPNVGTMHANYKYYRDRGVSQVFSQGNTDDGPHADFAQLKAWLAAKWLWNPDLEQGPLVDAFMSGYYGAASNLVRQVFEAQEALPVGEGLYNYTDVGDATWLTDDFLDWAEGVWREAEAAVADDPECLYNVRMSALSAAYAALQRKMLRLGGLDADSATWLCDRPRRLLGIDFDDLARRRDWVTNAVASARGGRQKVSEFSKYANGLVFARWDAALATSVPERGARSAAFGPRSGLRQNESAEVGTVVEEADSFDGHVYELTNANKKWSPSMSFDRIVMDATTNYAFRVRVRVEKTSEAAQYGSTPMFTFGVYDESPSGGGNAAVRTVRVKDVGEGWQWYEARLKKAPDLSKSYFWFQPGGDETPKPHPAFAKIVFDRLEIANLSPGLGDGLRVLVR